MMQRMVGTPISCFPLRNAKTSNKILSSRIPGNSPPIKGRQEVIDESIADVFWARTWNCHQSALQELALENAHLPKLTQNTLIMLSCFLLRSLETTVVLSRQPSDSDHLGFRDN